ncbi:DNA-binding transcriptional regulator, MerR family [Methylobacterium sp. UNC378MF]|uniref:MerR family transcriptional regulator n=1 Tax=Methylobacterium sp. UNC378MF TaxID=1502748 RepID=UPI00088EDF30|nr:MerR family transcriptional regulator [Methylobacterium sp. UNC378MF]SDA32570.1 DNA-binding transcriptional regulator, MerR family [Methylobacterium sp. UNC378MF]
MSITIKELSERSGVKVPTIRYYERQGLLPEPVRTVTGLRRYGTVDVARLRFVRFGRGLGMEIDGIRAVIEMVGDGNGEEIIAAADALGERAERMQALCVSLRRVSAAIIGGSIDEAEAFDRLIARERAEVVVPVDTPPAPNPDATEAPQGQSSQPMDMTVVQEEASTAVELAAEEPTAEAAPEGDAPETPLSKPKRKRTRAKL